LGCGIFVYHISSQTSKANSGWYWLSVSDFTGTLLIYAPHGFQLSIIALQLHHHSLVCVDLSKGGDSSNGLVMIPRDSWR
jgi:hypothetical protein